MGGIVRERLQEEKIPFVVIEQKEDQLSCLTKDKDCMFITGDATLEEVLISAGIKRAKGLAALLATDADNLYLTMTAKLINPSLFVLARVVEDEAEKKLLQIGANKVVGPIKLGALKIAQTLVRPALVDFMDLIIRRKELSLAVEEYVLTRNAPSNGKSLVECNIRKVANVIVMAVKKPGQDIVFNPSPEIKLETGDTLLVLGARSAISVFEKTFLEAGI
jgi:voltage-gated potassium channel